MTQITSDSELWRACRDGERDAFRHVVERYQGLITSITYNATGDIPVSEDLAQDTFLQAWRKIGSLKEPEKLSAWLCTIARNRVRDWLRRRRTDLNRGAVALENATPTAHAGSPPDDKLVRADEAVMVWRAIESIPDDYREVLILHYRQEADTAQMAEALQVSEDAVRQRLSRARRMVRREVEAVVERGLRRTRPSPAFTMAVMAALPAVTPKVATAAVGGGAAAKSAGSLFSLGILIGPILGLLGGLYGTWLSIKNTDSHAERRFMVRYAVVLWVMVCIFMGALWLANSLLREHFEPKTFVLLEVLMLLVYAGLLVPVVLWANKKQRAIRREQGTPQWSARARLVWTTPTAIYGGLGGAIFGSMAWMVLFAVRADDWITAVLVTASAVVIFVISTRTLKRRGPSSATTVVYSTASAIALITLIVTNTRMHAWLAQISDKPIESIRENMPIWTLNMLMISAFILVFTVIRLGMTGKRMRGSSPPA